MVSLWVSAFGCCFFRWTFLSLWVLNHFLRQQSFISAENITAVSFSVSSVTTVGSCGPLPWLCGFSLQSLNRASLTCSPSWWRLAGPYTSYWIKSWGSVCGCSSPRPPPQAAAHLWVSESFSPHFSQAAHISAMFPPRERVLCSTCPPLSALVLWLLER